MTILPTEPVVHCPVREDDVVVCDTCWQYWPCSTVIGQTTGQHCDPKRCCPGCDRHTTPHRGCTQPVITPPPTRATLRDLLRHGATPGQVAEAIAWHNRALHHGGHCTC